ncbi:MAG: Crp/Fnr family transcriptional regulator [Armatimonadetes bacterium]|nr:Crp/Fnr family transcriptional regulator [Armatimonadota bacterium]
MTSTRNPQAEEIARRLQEVPLFAVLDESARLELARQIKPRKFRYGQPIFLQGDPGDEMYLILEGEIRISRESPSGREVTLAILRDGNFFGDMVLLDGHPRSASAYAVTGCDTLMLRRSDFDEHLGRHPQSARKLLAYLSMRLRLADEKIQDLALLTVRQRLAAVLAEIALREGQHDEGGVLLPKSVNHRVLAGLLGTSRETVSRMAAELKTQGLIEQVGRRVKVLHLEGLQAVVQEAG